MTRETSRPRAMSLMSFLCVVIVVLVSIGGLIFESRVDSLIRDLRSKSRARRIWAVQTLGSLKDRSAVNAIGACLEDEDPIMRTCAVRALGQINDPKSVEILTSAKTHWDKNVRKEAMKSLSKSTDYFQALMGHNAPWPPR